jgi:U3 small nucleolar RNA-associated protein 25
MHNMYMLHLLNHVLTARGRIGRNNKQLKAGEEKKTDEKTCDKEDETEESDSRRDQGYTRPTVLVLLPTRGTCYTFINQLMKMVGAEVEGEHQDRFETDFGPMKDEEEAELDPKNERRRKEILKKKGSSWNELFGDDVNQDDDFKMGISMIPKAAKTNAKGDKTKQSNVQVKLYTNFYKSDIIVTSPLGLKMLTTPEDEDKECDIDFLSSIEICLMEYTDVMLMQNWDHVNDIISLLNQEPRNNNSTDFSRVRNYLLEGQGASWRQLIVSSSITDPSILSTFKRNAKSLSGSVKVRRRVAPEDAAISSVLVPVKQVFQQVSSTSFEQQSDARLSYFTKTILPHILRQKQKHTMIYIPSYFDFCSLRNVFLKRDIDFVTVNEYSRVSEITRGRARFVQGRKPIMLYTGRGHFFHRHLIKGVRHLIFFGLPEHADFYSEQVNLLETSNESEEDDLTAATTVSSCLALFTKYDAHSLERVVGSSNCNRMVSSEKSTFMFYS